MRVSARTLGGLGQPAHPAGHAWFTVGPTEPWSTICSILASGGSCSVAKASSRVFFCMSSMATSTGVNTVCRVRGRHALAGASPGQRWWEGPELCSDQCVRAPACLPGSARAWLSCLCLALGLWSGCGPALHQLGLEVEI